MLRDIREDDDVGRAGRSSNVLDSNCASVPGDGAALMLFI